MKTKKNNKYYFYLIKISYKNIIKKKSKNIYNYIYIYYLNIRFHYIKKIYI